MAIAVTFGRVRSSTFAAKPSHARLPTLRYRLGQAGEVLEGLPDFTFQLPDVIVEMTEAQRRRWVTAGSDFCTIENTGWFIRCAMAHQLIGARGTLGYGVWVEVSAEDYKCYGDNIDVEMASHLGPFTGRLANRVPDMAETLGLDCRVHLSDEGKRPRVELLACEHPFFDEQRSGVTVDRALSLAQLVPGFTLALDA